MAIVIQTKQEQEWKIAQDINLSIDLITATKQHLQFLSIIDHNRWISENGPTLQRAIYRYNECWIPLLAKHTESPLFEGPLVVPLDCEWIWHCHRLNPIAYISDCQAMYAMILDNKNVLSSTQENSEKQTKIVWEMLYPNESFILDMNDVVNVNYKEKVSKIGKLTKYDLESAVQSQSLFYSEVSGPHMTNDIYLGGAVAKYKGFLNLIKRDMEQGIDNFLAPTYDIDLIWHTHQLHPIYYCNDLVTVVGMVIGHDDTVTDRTKGQKLDVGFTTTINIWYDMYGSKHPIIVQSKASPCGKPVESKNNNFIVAQNVTSPCGKPVEGNSNYYIEPQTEVSPCGKPVESKVSPCGKPEKSMIKNIIVSYLQSSPCGKPNERKPSCCVIAQVEASPCGKPSESMVSPCGKPSESMASPCGKPMESNASPCGKPMESNVSPCGKPMESNASPCGMPIRCKVSFDGNRIKNKTNDDVNTHTKASPCGKPGVIKTNAYMVTHNEVNPCGMPGKTKPSTCTITPSEAGPSSVPWESNTRIFNNHGSNVSACIFHGSNACPCGIPCA